jgi:phage gp37-like protein
MIQEIQTAIVAELDEIDGVTVTAWQGDIEELLDSPLTPPCIQVIYQGAAFGPRKTMGYRQWDTVMEYLIVVTDKDNASRIGAAQDCYTVIESVRSRLAGHVVTGYGALEPVKEERLMSVGGVVMYGLTYTMDVDVTVT